MSDDVFAIATAFGDVAELGQGYINRADGERILVPLPAACDEGEGVRFIVHLADGTPAFAGAGRCAQVSDQGDTVPEAERYETLLDNLAFDDRSRPVYEYIVAVRHAVYAAGGPEGGEEAHEAVEGAGAAAGAAVDEGVSDEEAALAEAAEAAEVAPEATTELEAEEEPTAFIDTAAAIASQSAEPVPMPSEAPGWSTSAEELAQSPVSIAPFEADADADAEPEAELHADDSGEAELEADASFASAEPTTDIEPEPVHAAAAYAEPEPEPELEPEPTLPPVAPLPTGMLQRPGIAAHWQPAQPKAPRPTKGTGLFRYTAAGLPVPAHPPRPNLPQERWVRPAPSPSAH